MKRRQPKKTEPPMPERMEPTVICVKLGWADLEYLEFCRAELQQVEGPGRIVSRSKTIRLAIESLFLTMQGKKTQKEKAEREQHTEGRQQTN